MIITNIFKKCWNHCNHIFVTLLFQFCRYLWIIYICYSPQLIITITAAVYEVKIHLHYQ